MRFRIKAGGPAARFTFDRTPKPQPPAPPVLRAADLDNPYGRYYGKARSWVPGGLLTARNATVHQFGNNL